MVLDGGSDINNIQIGFDNLVSSAWIFKYIHHDILTPQAEGNLLKQIVHAHVITCDVGVSNNVHEVDGWLCQ
jgi:hypothetical protein